MLSIAKCRQLLGPNQRDLSDQQIEALRTGLYEAASVVLALRVPCRVRTDPEASALAAVPESDREVVEERAAVLEFDANMSRDTATRQALHAYVRTRPERPA
jgi:hypothetical protein